MAKKNVKPPKKVIPEKSMISWHSYVADKGGCGHIRVIYPSLLLNAKRFGNNNIQINPSYNMRFIMDKDYYKDKLFIILQRAATKPQLEIIKRLKNDVLKESKTQIIYEIDDDLIDIPEWNFANDYYNKNRENCIEIIKRSFGVTTSTEFLAQKLRKYNKSIVVNPNHLPKFMWGDVPEVKERHKKPKILWSGSQNHFALPQSGLKGGDFGDELYNFIKKTTDIYEWIFVGALPRELMEVKDKITFYNWQGIFDFPRFMKSLNADVAYAPLIKHDFNRSKSNIKAKEYIACGVPAVYSNVTPYENLTLTCDTDEQIIAEIEKLASDDDYRQEVNQKDHDILRPYLFWEENDNLKKYVNNFLSFFNMRLPNES